MSTVCEFELNGQEEIYEFNKVAKQANGSVLAKKGKAVVMLQQNFLEVSLNEKQNQVNLKL